MENHKKLTNAIIFQIVWWSILILKSQGHDLWLIVIAMLGIGAQLLLLRTQPLKRLGVWLALAALGFAIDFGIAQTPIFQFTDQEAPIWLFLIWVIFVSTLNHSMAYFRGQYVLSSIGGAIFGPICYIAAAQWGLLNYTTNIVYNIAHGVAWAIIFNLFLYLTHLGEKKCAST